jgi:hypothetical protein
MDYSNYHFSMSPCTSNWCGLISYCSLSVAAMIMLQDSGVETGLVILAVINSMVDRLKVTLIFS